MTAVEGVGPQHDRASAGTDPRGILVFYWLPDDLQRAEDSTQAADRERTMGFPFEREATPTERILLQHLGYQLPEQLVTAVSYPSSWVRCRRWPALEEGNQPS